MTEATAARLRRSLYIIEVINEGTNNAKQNKKREDDEGTKEAE